MKTSFKKIPLLILLFFFAVNIFAQKDDQQYKEQADAVRSEVWGWKKPEFAVRQIPSQYANASKVIIAKHTEINTDSRKKINGFVILGGSVTRNLFITEIIREAVKINDKSALADYSEFSFTKFQKSWGNATTAFVGVRVYKANGGMKEIIGDDIIMTKDEKKQKKAKLAIPDLQVGDIIDYFVASTTKKDETGISEYYDFPMFNDAPVMSFTVHCEIGKKFAVNYRNYNGAPKFKESTNDDGDNILDISAQNLPAYPDATLWTSTFKQLPVVRLLIKFAVGAGGSKFNKPGIVYSNRNADEYIEEENNFIGMMKRNSMTTAGPLTYLKNIEFIPWGDIKKLCKDKNVPKDTLALKLFYMYRYKRFLEINPTLTIYQVTHLTNFARSNSSFCYLLGSIYKEAGIENSIVYATTQSGPRMNEIVSSDDINYLLLMQDNKKNFLGIDDVFSFPYNIPADFENTSKAIALDTKELRMANVSNFEQTVVNIPATAASENARLEKLGVTIAPDGHLVNITRTTTLKGHYKSDVQRSLILVEDYCNAERKALGATNTILDELNDKNSASRNFSAELKTAFDQERAKQKDAFTDEAKDWFGQEIKNLSDNKIVYMGVRHTAPDLVFSSKFDMEGLVKKAGNNLMIEVGKLQGAPLQLKPEQRKRTLDIYMPFARSLQTEVTLQIPAGYTVDGIANLNKKVENDCGFFICEAASNGNTVTIKVKKSYNHIFEPVANWDKILAFLDAASEWSNAKILLRKTGQ